MNNDFSQPPTLHVPAGISPEPVTWSARRWACAIAAVFFIQIAVIRLLEKPIEIVPARPLFKARIYLAAKAVPEELMEIHDLQDPTLFALPHLKGFSGAAWLSYESPPPPMTTWDEPPRWLPLNTRGLGGSFTQLVSSIPSSKPPLPRSPVERMAGLEVYVPSSTLEKRSVLRVEGDLAGRGLTTPAELPSWPHTEILSDTTIQLLVDEQGYTLSATPLKGSGLMEADEYAVRFSRAARFERSPPEITPVLTWGQLTFDWATVPTNAFLEPPPPQ